VFIREFIPKIRKKFPPPIKIVVFDDWLCCPQWPRTDDEQDIFDLCLEHMTSVYVYSDHFVFFDLPIPESDNTTYYTNVRPSNYVVRALGESGVQVTKILRAHEVLEDEDKEEDGEGGELKKQGLEHIFSDYELSPLEEEKEEEEEEEEKIELNGGLYISNATKNMKKKKKKETSAASDMRATMMASSHLDHSKGTLNLAAVSKFTKSNLSRFLTWTSSLALSRDGRKSTITLSLSLSLSLSLVCVCV